MKGELEGLLVIGGETWRSKEENIDLKLKTRCLQLTSSTPE